MWMKSLGRGLFGQPRIFREKIYGRNTLEVVERYSVRFVERRTIPHALLDMTKNLLKVSSGELIFGPAKIPKFGW